MGSPNDAETAPVVDFDRDIAPIFEAYCLDCHDSGTLKGGVGLETFYHAQLPTDAGDRLIVPKDTHASVLMHVIESTDEDVQMPPKGARVSPEEVRLLKDWINQGAVWPDDGWRPPVHWSFVKPENVEVPALPEVTGNEIDKFIGAQLLEAGIPANGKASSENLLRRLYLDTIGLPPTVEQLTAFLADPSPQAYQAEVDKLLSSPNFGEKWAIPWLDLARYADSEGYQKDVPRNMWPYRDWVIRAINEDMPFDQFSIEQLAGDLLENPTIDQKVATAFNRNSTLNLEAGTDPKEDHFKYVVDRTNTVGSIWLGLTVACAQCHNHKYDPISAKEYYELFAFFNNTPMESEQKGQEMTMAGLDHIGPELAVPMSDGDRAFLQVEEKRARDLLCDLRNQYRTILSNASIPDQLPKKIREQIAKDAGELGAGAMLDVVRALKVKDQTFVSTFQKETIMRARINRLRQNKVRVMVEMPEVRPTFVAKRGDFLTKGVQVQPATPDSLHPFPADAPSNRLGLAQWLVSPESPLVGRTFVNRMWIEIFGQGLVTTPEEFGSQGAMPTHPELLDWLSYQFVHEDGFSLKRALMRILLSETYQRSRAVNAEAHALDPNNQLVWRHLGHRLNAETIRDQALHISGLLVDQKFGPNVRPYQPASVWGATAGASEKYWLANEGQERHRRGVYTLWRRNNHYPSFANFDAPDRSLCVVQRDRSNTPLQALTLLNDPAFIEMAKAFGARIREEGGEDLDSRIDWAFLTALSRAPSDQEKNFLKDTFSEMKTEGSSDERIFTEFATILLNLHETITRS